MSNVLVTGSSGFVASSLIPKLRENGFNVFGLDRVEGALTDLTLDIAAADLRFIDIFSGARFSIINLAAERYDFGSLASKYYFENVSAHESFFRKGNLEACDFVVHLSSVAAIDGESISYSNHLSCDDAYRSTKFLQAEVVRRNCFGCGVNMVEVLPSAIYDLSARMDTNIGVLDRIAKYLPVIPRIEVHKSITNLETLSEFIIYLLENRKSGRYLAVDRPIQTVTQLLQERCKENARVVCVPGLPWFLYGLSFVALGLYKLFGIDLKLFPNRVNKLFSDTSYSGASGLDRTAFSSFGSANNFFDGEAK